MIEPPILPPSEHESLKAPRTMLAIAIFLLFAITVLLPYFQSVPTGAASNLILTTGETVKNIVLLVVGYFFGTSQGSTQNKVALERSLQTNAALAETAKTAGEALAATAGGDAGSTVTLQPGDSVKVDATDPDHDPADFGGPRP